MDLKIQEMISFDLCFECSQTGINNLDEKTRDLYNTHLNKYETYKEYKNELIKCDSDKLVIEINYCKTHPFRNCQIIVFITVKL